MCEAFIYLEGRFQAGPEASESSLSFHQPFCTTVLLISSLHSRRILKHRTNERVEASKEPQGVRMKCVLINSHSYSTATTRIIPCSLLPLESFNALKTMNVEILRGHSRVQSDSPHYLPMASLQQTHTVYIISAFLPPSKAHDIYAAIHQLSRGGLESVLNAWGESVLIIFPSPPHSYFYVTSTLYCLTVFDCAEYKCFRSSFVFEGL